MALHNMVGESPTGRYFVMGHDRDTEAFDGRPLLWCEEDAYWSDYTDATIYGPNALDEPTPPVHPLEFAAFVSFEYVKANWSEGLRREASYYPQGKEEECDSYDGIDEPY